MMWPLLTLYITFNLTIFLKRIDDRYSFHLDGRYESTQRANACEVCDE